MDCFAALAMTDLSCRAVTRHCEPKAKQSIRRRKMMKSYVYILFNKKNGTLYTGVTSNLKKRMYEHKNKIFKGFTEKYSVDKLGYYEIFNDIKQAIEREKQIKAGSRMKKIMLIEKINREWNDLSECL